MEIGTQPPTYEVTRRLIHERSARVGIVGLGRVGLPLAISFSRCGVSVEGIDADPDKVTSLAHGRSYLRSVAAEEIALASNRGFHVTTELSQVEDMDAVIICIPGVLIDSRQPNLTLIRETAFSIAPHLRAGQLVILENTIYPGTTEEIVLPILEQANSAHLCVSRETASKNEIFLACSPECHAHVGTAVSRPESPKIVGGVDRYSRQLALDLYARAFKHIIPVSSPMVAELGGLIESVRLYVDIALQNELKQLFLRMGLDAWEVIDAADGRPYQPQNQHPQTDLGDDDVPVGPLYVSSKASEYGFSTRFIELALEINRETARHIVACACEALNQRKKAVNGARILVLGTARAADQDRMSFIPCRSIIDLLHHLKAEVDCNDPFVALLGSRQGDCTISSSFVENLSSYDAVVIATHHPSYDYRRIAEEAQLVIDAQNATRGIISENIVRC